MNRDRLRLLTGRYFDREIDAAEMDELQALLRASGEAKAAFWEDAEWHALFRQWGEQEWGRQAVTPPAGDTSPALRMVPRPATVGLSRKRRRPLGAWLISAGAVAAAVALGFLFLSPRPVAGLERQLAAAWNGDPLRPGDRLQPGDRHRLDSGTILIAMDRGARVVVEGPAEFELTDDNALRLVAGRLRATVPPAAMGFTVTTPAFTAIDRGTEFGCLAGPGGSGELHVIDGEVDLESKGAPTGHLRANEAMRVANGTPDRIDPRALSFAGEEEMDRRELVAGGDPLAAWRIASDELSRHPAAVLHLDFEATDGRVLRNRADADAGAVVHGGLPDSGRWPGKGALAISAPDDGLEFRLPGEFESLTLTAWVRPDTLLPGKNPLVMGQTSEAGEVTWYLYGSGGLGLGVRSGRNGGTPAWVNFHTDRLLPLDGEPGWVFAATVIDGRSGTVTHYFDGQPVPARSIGGRAERVHPPFQLRHATIGNVAFKELRPGTTPDRFQGSIDELTLFSSALPAGEIRRLFERGDPGTR